MEEPWTILRVLQWTQGKFTERKIPTARLDAEVLLAHVTGKNRVGLYTHFDHALSDTELASYRALIKRRLGGEPVAYLVGKKEFRSLDLAVDARVLVPRPDTETLVEVALKLLPFSDPPPFVVDVGTGSGAIAIAIAVDRTDARVEAVDRSADAAEVARANAATHAPTVVVHVGDLLGPIAGPIDLVVSNPPYIPTGDLATLQLEVQKEPRAALDGGKDGLDLVRRLATEAFAKLAPGGAIAIEIGMGQAEATAAILVQAGFIDPDKTLDLGGIERVVSARRS
jgi:release factor glutamine methyltransferase